MAESTNILILTQHLISNAQKSFLLSALMSKALTNMKMPWNEVSMGRAVKNFMLNALIP